MLPVISVKIAAMVALSGGSYLTGTLPSCLGLGKGCRQSLLLSLTLCFGGGVLLATSVIHIMPEARNQMPDWADKIFCFGFMTLYLIDEIVKLFGEKSKKTTCQLEVDSLLDSTIHHRYGSISRSHSHNEEGEHTHEESEETVPEEQSTSNRFGLLLAFSIHSIIEGLAIGVQPILSKVLLLLGAVSSHKLVVAFCLGAELVSDGRSFVSLSRSLLVYALGSTAGIALGMSVDQWSTLTPKLIVPTLQALAAGSLLYVTVSEVLPRERSRWEHQEASRIAGLLQFLFVTLGFTVIVLLLMLV